MKNIVIVLVGFIVLSHQFVHAQETWNRKYSFSKSFKEGGIIFSYIKDIDKEDSLSFYGYFDSYRVYNEKTGQMIQQASDSNAMKKNGVTYKSAGIVKFTHSHSTVYSHIKINGNDYLGIVHADSTVIGTGFASNILKLNVQKNLCEGIGNLKFDNPVKMIAPILGTSKAYITGDFYNAKDATGVTRTFIGNAVWDMSNNTLKRVYYASDPTRFSFGGYTDHSISKKDGTILAMATWAIKVVPPGIDPSITLSDPVTVPSGGRFIACVVADKNRIYTVWQKDSVNYPCYLLKLKNDGTWQQMARFTNTVVNYSSDNWVTNAVYDETRDEFLLSGTFTHINGKPVNNVVKWRDQNNVFSNLPPPPFLNTNGMARSRVDVVGGEIFLIEDNSSLIFGQNIYVLSDITPPSVPNIIGHIGEDKDTVVSVFGSSDKNVFVDIYLNTNTKVSVSSDTAGKWSYSWGDLPEGFYSIYAKSRDGAGNVSASSQVISFERKSIPNIVTAVLTPKDDGISIFPNPATNNSVYIKNAISLGEIFRMDGGLVSKTFSKTDHGLILDISNFASGIYILDCQNMNGRFQKQKLVVLK